MKEISVKIYEITLKPRSGFGTPLKGDTVFGQFCWQAAHDDGLLCSPLSRLLAGYRDKPFAVFSSAYPRFTGDQTLYALSAPALPPDELFDLPADKRSRIELRKQYKSKRWMLLEENRRFDSFKALKFVSDTELLGMAKQTMSRGARKLMKRSAASGFFQVFEQPHNTINRVTGTTGDGGFAPFSVAQNVYPPETQLALFIGIDEGAVSHEMVVKGLERIGETGFGKDASTGLGRFEVCGCTPVSLLNMGNPSPNACFTLSPCVPESGKYAGVYFKPFTRFGKHGDLLAVSPYPFKNPVIMADEGAVVMPGSPEVFQKPYIGRAVENISKAEPATVAQGYSLYLPVRVEV